MPSIFSINREKMLSIYNKILEADNVIIGFLICIIAIYDWILLYDGLDELKIYFSQGIYAVSSLSTLSVLFSAIYLTFAAIILLSLKKPKSRYKTFLPNFFAIIAAFATYLFIFMPGSENYYVSVYISLSILLIGSSIILVSLVYLRQAFSVTPQARFLVQSGPYSIIRHPMYVGNIASLLGLALLIGGYHALILFIVCASMQVGRAMYEEKLLEENFEEYSVYKSKVGGFFPRIAFFKPIAVLTICFLFFYLQISTGAFAISAVGNGTKLVVYEHSEPSLAGANQFDIRTQRSGAVEGAIILIAQSPGNWAAKCKKWHSKALSGRWFSKSDQNEFSESEGEERLYSIGACKDFFELETKCAGLAAGWMLGESEDEGFLNEIESVNGCKSIVGFNAICEALSSIADKGIILSNSRRDIYSECLIEEIRKKRFNLLRPMM